MAGNIKLSKEEQKAIQEKIASIEAKAHTRIVIHAIKNHTGDLYQAAVREFPEHGLHHDKIKTGILLLISVKSRQFQILGDQHIHEKMGEAAWQSLAQNLSRFFKEEKFYDGLLHFLTDIEGPLTEHFAKK